MSILSLATTDVTAARQTVGEVTRFHFNGGTFPQFNINTTEAFVENQIYTFSGVIESIASGGIHGYCYGGGATALIDSAGSFSLSVTPEDAAYGQTIFTIRGLSGTVAVMRDITLELVT